MAHMTNPTERVLSETDYYIIREALAMHAGYLRVEAGRTDDEFEKLAWLSKAEHSLDLVATLQSFAPDLATEGDLEED